MKKVSLILFAILFVAGLTSVSAQNAPKKEVFGFNKKYMDEIGVSAESQAKIEDIKKASDIEMKAVREDQGLSEEDKKVKLKTLGIKRQKAIYSILTPEEIEKATAMMTRIKAQNEASGQ